MDTNHKTHSNRSSHAISSLLNLIKKGGSFLFSLYFSVSLYSLERDEFYSEKQIIDKLQPAGVSSPYKIACTLLSKQHRPYLWPKHIAFGAGINHDKKKIFFNQASLFKPLSIRTFESDAFLSLEDLELDSSGMIYLIDSESKQLSIYAAHPSFERLKYHSNVPVDSPKKLAIDQQNNIFVLSKKNIITHVYSNSTTPNYSSNEIKIPLQADYIQDIATLENQFLLVLTQTTLLTLDYNGEVISTTQLPETFHFIETTLHGDIFLLNRFSGSFIRLSNAYALLESGKLSKKDIPIQDMTLFKEQGYLAVYNNKGAALYFFNPKLKNISISHHEKISKKQFYQLKFILTAPAIVSILGENMNTLITEEIFLSGHYSILIDLVNPPPSSSKIIVAVRSIFENKAAQHYTIQLP